MDKKKIVTRLASKLKRNKADINNLLEALAGVIADECGKGNVVAIPSFGMFEAKLRDERVVYNPTLGKHLLIPPRVNFTFKLSNVLKNKLAKSKLASADDDGQATGGASS